MILDVLSNDKKLQEQILDVAYLKKRKKSKFVENIFSIKNLYKNWKKYKLITILGKEISFESKDYVREVN